ncbi:hypothetical protein EYF80_046121 [Liparis tanakae]|uniref:Uncharacterized protein n=1 Tax=Liparis tanakae TaxID=230148 RepID=A0A4Z2FR94_9TELE|nr:hypothetical protein EYF80_046121 [Liparis tanakae]
MAMLRVFSCAAKFFRREEAEVVSAGRRGLVDLALAAQRERRSSFDDRPPHGQSPRGGGATGRRSHREAEPRSNKRLEGRSGRSPPYSRRGRTTAVWTGLQEVRETLQLLTKKKRFCSAECIEYVAL